MLQEADTFSKVPLTSSSKRKDAFVWAIGMVHAGVQDIRTEELPDYDEKALVERNVLAYGIKRADMEYPVNVAAEKNAHLTLLWLDTHKQSDAVIGLRKNPMLFYAGDAVQSVGEEIFEKPHDREDFFRMARCMSGKTVTIRTAFSVLVLPEEN